MMRQGFMAAYPTSRDYAELWRRAQSESLACIVDWHECRDLAQTIVTSMTRIALRVSCRGTLYLIAESPEELAREAERINLEWIVPPSDEKKSLTGNESDDRLRRRRRHDDPAGTDGRASGPESMATLAHAPEWGDFATWTVALRDIVHDRENRGINEEQQAHIMALVDWLDAMDAAQEDPGVIVDAPRPSTPLGESQALESYYRECMDAVDRALRECGRGLPGSPDMMEVAKRAAEVIEDRRPYAPFLTMARKAWELADVEAYRRRGDAGLLSDIAKALRFAGSHRDVKNLQALRMGLATVKRRLTAKECEPGHEGDPITPLDRCIEIAAELDGEQGETMEDCPGSHRDPIGDRKLADRPVYMASRAKLCGQDATLICDGLCSKAWGMNSRPRIKLSDDDDDIVWLADDELPDAPSDPGTYEGKDAKPRSHDEAHNRWCWRECERSSTSMPGDPLMKLRDDWSRRVCNITDPYAEIAAEENLERVAADRAAAEFAAWISRRTTPDELPVLNLRPATMEDDSRAGAAVGNLHPVVVRAVGAGFQVTIPDFRVMEWDALPASFIPAAVQGEANRRRREGDERPLTAMVPIDLDVDPPGEWDALRSRWPSPDAWKPPPDELSALAFLPGRGFSFMAPRSTPGDSLRGRRKAAGLTMRDMADMIGAPVSVISAVELDNPALTLPGVRGKIRHALDYLEDETADGLDFDEWLTRQEDAQRRKENT